MKSRTLVILVLAVLVLATVAVVLRQQGGEVITDWLASVHGRPPGH